MTALTAEQRELQLKKWSDFETANFRPWEASEPASQLVKLVAEGKLLEEGSKCIELGCGSGLQTRWLASKGFDATGIDLVRATVERATGIAAEERSTAQFFECDVFALPEDLIGKFDFVYDSQCFHCTRTLNEKAAVEAIASLLKAGGILLVITGNSNEPEAGPAVLSRAELESAFSGLFETLDISEDRFDHTPHYGTLPRRPLAWVGVFRRR